MNTTHCLLKVAENSLSVVWNYINASLYYIVR